MKQIIIKYGKVAFVALFGIGIFLFWYCGYPEAMCYQEQNQLFLWSADYFCRDISVAGGLADYLSEFLVQFYYIPALGAAILACLFMAFLTFTYQVLKSYTDKPLKWYWQVVALFPSCWLLAVMGDFEVLLSFPVSLTLALLNVWLLNVLTRKWGAKIAFVEIVWVPILFWWIGGGAVWLYVLLRIAYLVGKAKKGVLPSSALSYLLMVVYLLGVQLVSYSTLWVQYPLKSVMLGINYYRIPTMLPGNEYGYNKDTYQALQLNMWVREGKWNEIIEAMQQNQVQLPYTSNCVNLALSQTRQLADRMFSFYQSGEDALFTPCVRDNMSMYPTMETFWRVGLVNSCLRYASDLQASILNGKMSGRLMKRITECQIVNGKYSIAQKNIDLLKQSLFYSDWAEKAEEMLGNETVISHDPEIGRARRFRFKQDMLYNYDEIDKMMGLLFVNNPENKMALDYFMGELLLKGKMQEVMQYMGWVQQYGGYQMMPLGYQDAVKCIQNQGNVPGSPYAAYVKRMMNQYGGGAK